MSDRDDDAGWAPAADYGFEGRSRNSAGAVSYAGVQIRPIDRGEETTDTSAVDKDPEGWVSAQDLGYLTRYRGDDGITLPITRIELLKVATVEPEHEAALEHRIMDKVLDLLEEQDQRIVYLEARMKHEKPEETLEDRTRAFIKEALRATGYCPNSRMRDAIRLLEEWLDLAE